MGIVVGRRFSNVSDTLRLDSITVLGNTTPWQFATWGGMVLLSLTRNEEYFRLGMPEVRSAVSKVGGEMPGVRGVGEFG